MYSTSRSPKDLHLITIPKQDRLGALTDPVVAQHASLAGRLLVSTQQQKILFPNSPKNCLNFRCRNRSAACGNLLHCGSPTVGGIWTGACCYQGICNLGNLCQICNLCHLCNICNLRNLRNLDQIKTYCRSAFLPKTMLATRFFLAPGVFSVSKNCSLKLGYLYWCFSF